MNLLQTLYLSPNPDTIAPDGAEIRFLCAVAGGSMVHCTLRPGQVTRAVVHQTVEEVWYFLQGQGQVYRRMGGEISVIDAAPGVSVSIPLGAHFQFRCTGDEPLCFIITTLPPWPGDHEAVLVENYWPPTQHQIETIGAG